MTLELYKLPSGFYIGPDKPSHLPGEHLHPVLPQQSFQAPPSRKKTVLGQVPIDLLGREGAHLW